MRQCHASVLRFDGVELHPQLRAQRLPWAFWSAVVQRSRQLRKVLGEGCV